MQGIDRIVGSHLKRLRKAYKLTQWELADYLTQVTGKKWDQQLVSRAETGKRPVRVVDLFAIAGIFEVSIAALMVPPDPDTTVKIGNMYMDGSGILQYWMGFPRLHRGDKTVYADRMPPPIDNFNEHITGFLETTKWWPSDLVANKWTEEDA